MKNLKWKLTIYLAVLYAIFILYLLALFKIILFKYFSPADILEIVQTDGEWGFRSLNLIPFVTMVDFGEIMRSGEVLRGISNIFGNMCVFAPLGYFLPFLFRRFERARNVFAAALGLSLFFEAAQYFLYLGSADIDDVILNLLGACAGYGFYRLIDRYVRGRFAKYRVTILLSVLCFAGAFFVAREQFGSILGISSHTTEYEGQENIPERDSDLSGTYLGLGDGTLRYYRERVAENSSERKLLTVQKAAVTEQTRYVRMEIEEGKKTTKIRYSPLTEEELAGTDPYNGILLWLAGDGSVDTVLFNGKIEDAEGEVSVESGGKDPGAEKDGSGSSGSGERGADPSETGDEETIWGEVMELTDEGFILNMGSTWEEGKGSVATMGAGENANPVEVELSDDAVYRKKIIHDQMGKNVDRERALRKDLETGQTVELTGRILEDHFSAEEVEIEIFDFME